MGIRKIGTSNICISLIPAINGEVSPHVYKSSEELAASNGELHHPY
jgi:hypothetical protein